MFLLLFIPLLDFVGFFGIRRIKLSILLTNHVLRYAALSVFVNDGLRPLFHYC